MRRSFVVVLAIGISFVMLAHAQKQSGNTSSQQQVKSQKSETQLSGPAPVDSSPSVSSSRQTKIDLSPPPGEAPAPGVGARTDDPGSYVQEMKPWNPHKADKNIEVGDYYFKQGNYRAAESRYLEALYWKDNDANAMFRLGEAQEKLGKYSDARKHYEGYLKVLPNGEYAQEARNAVDRLKGKHDKPAEKSPIPYMPD